jgi:hypothetical protein
MKEKKYKRAQWSVVSGVGVVSWAAFYGGGGRQSPARVARWS